MTDKTADHRWINKDRTKCTYIETLQTMCNYYGTFQGRWHSNDFWMATKNQIPLISEEEAEKKVREIEADADAELWHWEHMQ